MSGGKTRGWEEVNKGHKTWVVCKFKCVTGDCEHKHTHRCVALTCGKVQCEPQTERFSPPHQQWSCICVSGFRGCSELQHTYTYQHQLYQNLSMHNCDCVCNESWIRPITPPVISAAPGRSGNVKFFYLLINPSDFTEASGFPWRFLSQHWLSMSISIKLFPSRMSSKHQISRDYKNATVRGVWGLKINLTA